MCRCESYLSRWPMQAAAFHAMRQELSTKAQPGGTLRLSITTARVLMLLRPNANFFSRVVALSLTVLVAANPTSIPVGIPRTTHPFLA
jgi:hypothetical protein